MYKIIPYCVLLLLLSCNSRINENTYHHPKEDNSLPQEVSAISMAWDEIAIDGWMISGSKLICKTPHQERIYSVYSLGNLQRIGAFGRKGHGNLEWVAPHLFAQNDSVWMVIDNGDRSVYDIKKGLISLVSKLSINEPVNDIKTISYPIVGYVSLTPEKQSLKIFDVEQDTLIDEIAFTDQTGKGQSSIYDFVWNVKDARIILGHLYSDTFIICSIDKTGKILRSDYYETDGKYSGGKCFYTDVQCGDYIYLLSQRNVDIEKMTGHSEIEVYGYDGKGKRKIILDFIADKMLLDHQGSRILLTSIADEMLHIVEQKVAPSLLDIA